MEIFKENKNTKIVLKDNKITKYTANSVSNSVSNEAYIQQLAFKLGIAPEVYKVGPNFIEMEYIDGYELDTFLKLERNIDRNSVKRLIRSALDKMYDNGINHNDLTGKNIMIQKDQTSGGIQIKIIDYGNASLGTKKRDYSILRNF